jgi:DNA-directed RNA polymerase sigma subunit (sigma70/sigma32)
MGETCVLDMADRGPHSLEDVGRAMNLTRERVRQLEQEALDKIRVVIGNDEVTYDTLTELLWGDE